MQDDILVAALGMAAEHLNTSERAWIVGVAQLVDLPLETESLSDEKVRSVLDIASATVQFPTGPISYMGAEYAVDLKENHRLVTLLGAVWAPHLEMQIGLGIGGFVAVALTRSDVFDDGSEHEGGIPLADLESVIADTYILAMGSSLAYGYTGRIDFAFDIFDARPGETVTGYAIDDETGSLTPAPIQPGFAMVTGSTVFDESTTPRSAHKDIHRMAVEATAQFGARPELTSMLGGEPEDYSGNPLLYQDVDSINIWQH